MKGLRKVLFLLIVIVLLNAVDLYLTAFHMLEFGFEENNPIADLFMYWGLGWLIAYKVVTVGIGVSLLLFLHKRRAKVVMFICWTFIVILISLILQWTAYTQIIDEASSEYPELDTRQFFPTENQ